MLCSGRKSALYTTPSHGTKTKMASLSLLCVRLSPRIRHTLLEFIHLTQYSKFSHMVLKKILRLKLPFKKHSDSLVYSNLLKIRYRVKINAVCLSSLEYRKTPET